MIKKFSKRAINIPKAIVMDTDDTLYPYDIAHKSAIEKVINKSVKDFKVSRKDFLNSFKQAKFETKKRLSGTASSHSRLLYFQRTIELLGRGSRIFSTLDLEQTYWREFLNNAKLFDGVDLFLQTVKSHGIKTANITDLTAQIQFRKMIFFNIDEYFDYVVTSEESGHDKPHISAFELMLEKLNLDPLDIWVIGDGAETDIIGAKESFDIITFQKINKKNIDPKNKPDFAFNNYQDLIKFFKTLVGRS